jgi:predicted ester cyclase
MTNRRELLTLALAGGTLLAGGRAAAAECAPGSPEAAASALLDRYVAVVNAHSTAGFAELFTEAYVQHSGRSPSGLAAQVENFKGLYGRMPDVRLEVEDRIVSGDRVAARMAFHATHTQPIQGIAPTGKRFVLRTMDIWKVAGGKFAEHWDLVDVAGLQKQLRGE